MQTISASVSPRAHLSLLTQTEVAMLTDHSEDGLYELVRRCALAVLNSGSNSDDGYSIIDQYPDFRIEVQGFERGIRLQIDNAPNGAFVDGHIITGIREHLFSVVRDLLYTRTTLGQYDLSDRLETSNAVFHLLRHADALVAGRTPSMVVCWGGHSINRAEYDYTKEVGHELGLRRLDICTGCGPGAMKGPMKGAAIAHSKQRITDGRYLGITEPGIIAAEAPNPIVNELVIMPDIEKRLEAFVRVGHGIIVFPGGPGTAEELLYLLGILMHPDNADQPMPLVLTGPSQSQAFLHQVDAFVRSTLGEAAANHYELIIDDPVRVAKHIKAGIQAVHDYRGAQQDAFTYNWKLHIDRSFQEPFAPTHENMAALNLSKDQPAHELAANLRRAFSGIVAGNVKAPGVQAVKEKGPFQLTGDADLMAEMDQLLQSFVEQGRMKLDGEYTPCYQIKR